MLHGCPYKWTGMIALVLGVIFFLIDLGHMVHVSFSISTNIGVAPTYLTTLAVATQVISGTITSSPFLIPNPKSIRCNAPVQLDVGRAYLHLKNFLN